MQLIGPLSLGVFLWTQHCGVNTQGTSIGLEMPMAQILQTIENSVDNTGVLSSWNQLFTQQPVRSPSLLFGMGRAVARSSLLCSRKDIMPDNLLFPRTQCPPYANQPFNGFPTYGGSWIGVSCINSAWPQSGLSASTFAPLRVGGVNLALSGSSQFNNTYGRLTGSLPPEVRRDSRLLAGALRTGDERRMRATEI